MSTVFHLKDKKILVSGASSGIGSTVAQKCAEMGAKLVLTGRNEERLLKTFKALSGKGHEWIKADLCDQANLQNLVHMVSGLDGFVHCAGIVKPFPVAFLSASKIKETFDPNFNTAVELLASLFKQKKINEKASLVLLSSVSAQHPHRGGALYAASKSALEAFCKTIALEYSVQKVRCNCIAPAMVKTPMFDHAFESTSEEAMERHVAKYPLGVGLPEDVAYGAIYLLSEASRWITGTTLIMDGGMLLAY
jgi:NAD(P)-dependent dehydrogenase (short-subunit alcohol dehydrogenase family)